MKETNEIDSYVKLKYGYPLTKESYNRMPDELIVFLYYELFLRYDNNIIAVNTAHEIRLRIYRMLNFRPDETLTTTYAWHKIKEYYNDNPSHT